MKTWGDSSYTGKVPGRKPKTEAERRLLDTVSDLSETYGLHRLDRIALRRAVIAALEAAEGGEE